MFCHESVTTCPVTEEPHHMHHRPTARGWTAPARRSARSPVARRALHNLAVALVAAAGTALAGQPARTPAASPGAVDAAAHRGAQEVGSAFAHAASRTTRTGTADASTTARSGVRRHGDHLREQPQQQAATTNPNCTLVVPTAPTSAAGLATPYQLVATDSRAGACHETNPDQSAFVAAAVFAPAAHALSIYHPLVGDREDRPGAAAQARTPHPGAQRG